MSEGTHNQMHATCRAGIDEKFRTLEERINRDEETTEKRLDGHALDIKMVNSMMARLIALQESSDKRLATLEGRKPFWESPIGIWVIKAAVIAIILIFSAAVGINSLDAIKTISVP
jgi:hypothetical protein